ncbi:MAG TPA: carboxypeptidase regulatory-like domain-containing protein, partial [Thermoanaerobaculia bacterium]|nr:carboxypeptidase regulatory-like domain-containing protein [Thermoanaerobaculia bacterium]
MKRAALLVLFSLLAAGGARAQHLAAADLQIQGSGLRVITVSATTGIDIPASIQTEFGGRQNDEAANVEGLVAAGELDGPGIDVPIRLETAPGHKFTIPALSREGIYFLRNVRLMKGGEFLQSATPSIATITVSNLLQTAVKVRQLTPEELRARGIAIDARNFEVFEYTFSFFIDGKIVEIPYPVIIDKRTREVRPLPKPVEFILPPVANVVPPRWSPPSVVSFGLGGDMNLPPEGGPAGGASGGGPGRPSIPAALVIPNNLAVLHQFFGVTLMVTNGAPEGSTVTLDGVTAMIRTPTELRVVKSVPASGFNLPVPVVDTANGVRFLVAQAKGDVDWTIEGLKPGTHTLEVEVRATYKSPGQADFPLKGNVRASIVVHDPRFNITFSHPDTVRKGIDYTTYSFVTNMSPVAQTIRVNSDVPTCAQSPLANICRTDNGPDFVDLTIPAGQMRMLEYKLRSSVTGSVFANAGSIDGNISAAVQLHMGVSETGIPLSPATLVMPYYAQFVDQTVVGANLALLGLGYSLATAPLTQALAGHPQVIKTDVFLRAVDIARAGQHIYLGEDPRDAVSHLALDLLGNGVELREWDDLRRKEQSGRTAGASVVRELEKNTTDLPAFVDRFAEKTAHRTGYALALLHGPSVAGNDRPYALSARGVTTNRKLEIPNEAGSGWIRDLPFADLSKFTSADGSRTGELAIVGRWTEQLELTLVPSVAGPHSLDLIYPAAADGTLLRAHVDLDGPAGRAVTVTIHRGDPSVSVRDALGAIVGVGSVSSVEPEPLRLIGARQDLHLDDNAHTVSVLFNRPAALSEGDDWLTKFHGQVILDKDGVHYTGPRPISAAALQESGRVVNLTFDHALSQNASYSLAVDPVKDPISGAAAGFPQPLTLVIDNDAPGGIVYGHVLAADNTPIVDAEVVLTPMERASQYDTSRAGDGSFLFEWVQRDVDLQITGAYSLRAVTTDSKVTSIEGSVRLPGRVHFVNLVFLGRGSAEGYVRYDDGTPVAEARVVIGSTLFDQFQSTTTDANGFYRATDLPVGPLTFSATDEDGNVAYLASEIKTPGQVLKKDLSIYRRPFPGLGVIRGLVKRSDTDAPVAGAHVGVFSQGYGLIDGYTDEHGRFEFAKVPTGFVTVLASEWTVSRESVALDFDLGPDERRDVVLTLNVAASEPLVTVEGDVLRENPLYPGDASKYEKVAGALVKIDKGQTVTADGNGRYVIPSVPVSASGDSITAYDPLTTRSSTVSLPALNPAAVNHVPIFIGAKSGGEGTVRVRVLNAGGAPALGMRVFEPGFPPIGPVPFTDAGNGVYILEHVPVGRTVEVWAVSNGGVYGDQSATGNAKVEFNGHIAPLNLRLGGQGTVRVKLQADIDIVGDVSLTYDVFDEAEQARSSKTVTASTAVNGQPDYAVFTKIPAATQDFTVASVHPVYGSAGQSGKLGFDGDLASITLQLNKLSTIRGTVYAIDGRTPIPGATVRLVDGRQDQGLYTTLQDGSFVFFNLPAGSGFRVVAEVTQAGVYRTGQASGTTPSLGGSVDGIALVMRTQGSIDGRVVYSAYKVFDPQNPANNVADDTPDDLSDNAPVPLARFSMKELGFPQRVFGTSAEPLGADLLGRFSFNNVFTGPLQVTASDPGNQEIRGAWTGTLAQEGERLTAYVGIGDTGFGSVSVSVVDPNAANAPVMNAEVSLFRGGSLFDFATTDGAGRVQFEQLPPGTYSVSAYSKAVGKSGSSVPLTIEPDTDTSVRIDLEFSGGVTGKLIDPEAGDRGIPGAHVSLQASTYDTRTTTGTLGDFLFEGVREGLFSLTAKDTLTNRRASASRALTQADPRPDVTLELEPTETLHIAVYEPNDTGGISNVLVPLVEATVTQRCGSTGCDYLRAAQGNPLQFHGALEQAPYSVELKEIGGQHRELQATASFPTGTAANPLKLVFPAYGNVEVRVTQANAPVGNARVTVAGGGTSATLYTDTTGVALATGIGLGTISVQASTLDGAFSGSATATLSSQSTKVVVTISLCAFAGVTGSVLAETGGPSANTRVVAAWPGRTLEMFTDSNGRYVFQGITTGTTVDLVYVGPDDLTVGARQSYAVKTTDASQIVTLPNVRLDATPPQLVSFTPVDGSLNVSPDTSLEFVFSEALQPQYVNSGYLQLVPADSSTPVNGIYTSFTQPDGKFVVRMTPPAGTPFPLASNTLYRIIVSGEVRDLTGNRMPGSRGGVFTTTDYAQPSVVKVTPAVTTPLSLATTFQFQFNEPIEGNIELHLYKISGPGAAGAIVREVPGRAFIDPESSLTLVFSPDEPMEPQSFYRTVFSGVRDRQGNAADAQTFHFFSFDSIRPFVILNSPLPDGFPLISGVEYTLTADIRDTDANGPPAADIARVDYLRVDGASTTFLKSETKTPFSYRFVAPEVGESGGTFTLRAEALDLSGNTSEPASRTWTVQPNQAPQNVAVTLTPNAGSFAGNRIHASIAFDDEGILATVQAVLTATQADGSPYTKSLVQQATRTSVAVPWTAASFDFDLPPALKENSVATVTATVTDARGQAAPASASLPILEDLVQPALVSLDPPAETHYSIGTQYTIAAVVQDLESGIQRVVFTFDGQTVTILGTDASVTPGAQPRSWRFATPPVTVPAKNVDTRIPITATVYDYHGNVSTRTVEIVYVGVNDPTIPRGAWLCPVDRATLPANQASLPVTLQVRATDDISVTGVKFTVPGIATPIAASRVGITDVWQATATVATPAAGTPFPLTAVISDANAAHDVTLAIAVTVVDADIFVDDRIQAVTAADLAAYENKTVVVRGATARLVPHVPLTLKNLIVLQGGKVESLSTTTTTEHKLDLTITDNLYVDCASAIDVTGRGYLGGWALNPDGSGTRNNDMRGRTIGNTADGGPSAFAAASHGGVGGESASGVTNAVYGSIASPASLGTGGGGSANCCNAGGSGGGAIQLQGGVFAVAGAIRADGSPLFGDGNPGSGGSVSLNVRQLITGPSARITANGGDDDAVDNASRGAGGGRIAVVASERFDVEKLGIQLAARGGRNATSAEAPTYLDGGAGTVSLKRPGQPLGELFIGNYDDRVPATLHLSRDTPVSDPSGTLRFDRVEAGQRALVRADSSIDVGGVVDTRSALTIDNSAAVLFPNDRPSLSVTTAPPAGASLPQGGSLDTTYTVTSPAGVGLVTIDWTENADHLLSSRASSEGPGREGRQSLSTQHPAPST